MRQVMVLAVLAFAVAFGIVVGNRLSSEAMAVVMGIVCGVLASIPTSILLLIGMHRLGDRPAQHPPQHPSYPPVIVINPRPGQPDRWRGPYDDPTPDYPPVRHLPRQFRIVGGDEDEDDRD